MITLQCMQWGSNAFFFIPYVWWGCLVHRLQRRISIIAPQPTDSPVLWPWANPSVSLALTFFSCKFYLLQRSFVKIIYVSKHVEILGWDILLECMQTIMDMSVPGCGSLGCHFMSGDFLVLFVRPHSLGTSLQKYLNSAYKYCPRKLKPTVVVMLLGNTGIHTETASALTCHSIQGEVFQTRSWQLLPVMARLWWTFQFSVSPYLGFPDLQPRQVPQSLSRFVQEMEACSVCIYEL